MKTTLIRLFTVMMLIMVSLGAKADVKVLFGEKGTELQPDKYGTITLAQKELTGGTITITQEDQKDGTTNVTFAVTPDKNYKLAENGLEVYAVIPTDISSTRGLEVSTSLTLKSEDFTDEALKRTYTTTIDSKLALWVKSADFQPQKRDGAKTTTPPPPPAGIWYIANSSSGNAPTTEYSYDASSPENNYYLVPAADPHRNDKRDAYYSADNYASTGDRARPFITTYKTAMDNNSIWFISPSGDGYYFIIHAATGKYLIYEPPHSAATNRKSMHLQTVDNDTYNPSTNNDFKFEINTSGIGYTIRPYRVSSGNKLFNVANRNFNNYYGPSGTTYYHEGLVGLYSSGHIWVQKDASNADFVKPVISNVDESTNTFTISFPTVSITHPYTTPLTEDITALGITSIIYTTNGDEPTVGGETTHTFSSAVYLEESCTVKARGVYGNNSMTPVVSKDLTPVITSPIITFDNTTGYVTLTTLTVGADIYYTLDGTTPNSSSNLYGEPFSVSETTTIKAITIKSGESSSVSELVVSQVATPTIQNNGSNAISITTTTPDATIYYTFDGSTPTTSSSEYTEPLTENVSNVTIKAIAIKEGMITSAVGSGTVTLQCATPVITRDGMTFTLSCSFPTDANLYYTLENGQEQAYTGTPVSFTSDDLPMTVTAVARHNDYTQSETSSMKLKTGSGSPEDPYLIYSSADFSNFVTNVNNGSTASACYKLGSDVSASGTNVITTPFTGSFDGSGYTISDLSHPLFNTVNGGVVKNVTLKNVAISSSATDVGAIAGIAQGYSRIYNCGILPKDATFPEGTHPFVTTTGTNAGGIVGKLDGDSRVINCYSYADVSATTTASGIVGYNAYVSGTTDGIDYGSTTKVENIDGVDKYTELRTAVVNCMFYGDIIGGSQVYPVYGGAKMLNKGENGINNYNFYRAKASINVGTRFNCSWPASEENLTRFEYYRYLLNSNRELCGWWVNSDVAPNTLTTEEVQAIEKDASLIAKWVLDPSIAPYPILKPAGYYPSVINQVYQPIESAKNLSVPKRVDPDTKQWVNRASSSNTIQTNTAPDTDGQTLGTITVTIKKNSTDTGVEKNYTITAMDLENNDFCYGKIQLPYYNNVFGNPNGTTWSAKYGGNYTDKVVTGWDITTTDGTAGTFSNDPITGNIFADRNSTAKDTHRVFAQGGYYYVPYGVGSITITAHWATAYYLGNGVDGYYDRVWFSNSQSGSAFAPAGTRSFSSGAFGGQSVNNGTIQSVLTSATAASTVYDCAIVLVGNHQYKNLTDAVDDAKKPFTIMSVDLDFDNEPDYCLEWQVGSGSTRAMVAPVRFDFLPVVELGVAMKEDASTNLFALGKLTPYGHFEVTETSVIHFGQFEYENKNRSIEAPVILNNGVFDQICRGTDGTNNQHITYFLLGGHVKMPSFTPGAHVTEGNNNKSRHCAVNVLGGEFTKFYLTGNYNNGVTPNDDEPHCYIDGGKLDMVASAAKEGINGSVYWKIDHGYIGEFYGGGISSDKRVTGSIEINIDRSKVTKFCGGPMFGDMYDDQTVTTTATGTTFGVYYGAGNGGTCYSQYSRTENTSSFPLSNYTATKYEESINGVTGMNGYHAKYEFELVNTSAGTDASLYYRTYLFAAQFATTNTGDVSNTLTDCTIETNFFGGGNLGGVTGSVTSELKGHTVVEGNVYGAGYSAKDLSVDVLPQTGYTAPKRDQNTAVISDPAYPNPTPYVWTNETTIGSTSLSTSSPTASSNNTNYLFTEVPLVNLGAVSQNVSLTIGGTSEVHQNVFGGGEESGVDGNTIVTLTEDAQVGGNVFGGGNNGVVSGSATVNIQ